MYNNIGLESVRGTATSGYVQTNRGYVRGSRVRRHLSHQNSRGPPANQLKSFKNKKKVNLELQEHGRKRRLESQILELRERLEARGDMTEDEINDRIQRERNYQNQVWQKQQDEIKRREDERKEALEQQQQQQQAAKLHDPSNDGATLKDDASKGELPVNTALAVVPSGKDDLAIESRPTRNDLYYQQRDPAFRRWNNPKKKVKETNFHVDAERKEHENTKFRNAFRIRGDTYKEGAAFDRELQQQKKMERRAKREEMEVKLAAEKKKEEKASSTTKEKRRRKKNYSSSSSSSSSSYSSSSSSSSYSTYDSYSTYSSSSYSSRSDSRRRRSHRSKRQVDYNNKKERRPNDDGDANTEDQKAKKVDTKEHDLKKSSQEAVNKTVKSNKIEVSQTNDVNRKQNSRKRGRSRSPSYSSASYYSSDSYSSRSRSPNRRYSNSRHEGSYQSNSRSDQNDRKGRGLKIDETSTKNQKINELDSKEHNKKYSPLTVGKDTSQTTERRTKGKSSKKVRRRSPSYSSSSASSYSTSSYCSRSRSPSRSYRRNNDRHKRRRSHSYSNSSSSFSDDSRQKNRAPSSSKERRLKTHGKLDSNKKTSDKNKRSNSPFSTSRSASRSRSFDSFHNKDRHQKRRPKDSSKLSPKSEYEKDTCNKELEKRGKEMLNDERNQRKRRSRSHSSGSRSLSAPRSSNKFDERQNDKFTENIEDNREKQTGKK